MKRVLQMAVISTLSAISALPTASFAQTPAVSSSASGSEVATLTDGEVRKIDREAGKITIKHGPIKHLDMPPMSMVFVAKDKSLLDKVKVGDKIRFMAGTEGGALIVTDIQPAQ